MNIVGDLVGPLRPSYAISHGPVDKENIYRRNGGCGVVVAEGRLYVWGGEGAEQRPLIPDSDSEEDDFAEEQVGGIWSVTVLPPPRIMEHPFDVYDMHTCSWSRQNTSGDVPLLGLGSSLNYHPETYTLYLFGGWNYGNFDAEVYRIKLDEWNWQKVKINRKPLGRYLTGTLIHEWRLCMLGGTGLDIRLQSDGKSQDTDEHKKLRDPGAQYHQTFFKGEGYGLNNEYHEFNIQTGEWSVPLDVSAVRPDPLSCHCFVKFDAHRAILFGGTYKDGRKNDTWIFDLEERIFTGPLILTEPCPTGRAFATLTPLLDPLTIEQAPDCHGDVMQQRMLLLWGKQLNETILTDAWLLQITDSIDNLSWTRFDVNTYARAWHIAGPLYYADSTNCRLAIFGGNVHWDGFVGKRRNIGDMQIALFGVASLARLCASFIARNRDLLSLDKVSPQAETLVDSAIQTLTNASPTLTVSRHQDSECHM